MWALLREKAGEGALAALHEGIEADASADETSYLCYFMHRPAHLDLEGHEATVMKRSPRAIAGASAGYSTGEMTSLITVELAPLTCTVKGPRSSRNRILLRASLQFGLAVSVTSASSLPS